MPPVVIIFVANVLGSMALSGLADVVSQKLEITYTHNNTPPPHLPPNQSTSSQNDVTSEPTHLSPVDSVEEVNDQKVLSGTVLRDTSVYHYDIDRTLRFVLIPGLSHSVVGFFIYYRVLPALFPGSGWDVTLKKMSAKVLLQALAIVTTVYSNNFLGGCRGSELSEKISRDVPPAFLWLTLLSLPFDFIQFTYIPNVWQSSYVALVCFIERIGLSFYTNRVISTESFLM